MARDLTTQSIYISLHATFLTIRVWHARRVVRTLSTKCWNLSICTEFRSPSKWPQNIRVNFGRTNSSIGSVFCNEEMKKITEMKKNAVAWCVVSSLIFNSIFHWPEQRIIKANILFLLSLRTRSLMTSSWIFIVALHKPVRYYYSRLQLLFYFRLFFSSFETNHWICIPLNCLIWCIIEYCFKCNSKLQLKTSLGFYQLKFSFISNVHEEMFYLKISVWNALESAFVVKIAFAWSFQLAIITSPLWVEGIDLSGNRKVQ